MQHQQSTAGAADPGPELESAQSRAQEAQRRARALGEALADAVLCIRGDGTFVSIKARDGSGLEMLGVSVDGVESSCIDELNLPKAICRELGELVATTLATQTTHSLELEIELDGGARHFQVASAPSAADEVMCVLRDTTSQQKLVAKMMELDRMVAVGTLASGVGHEINNPLTYIGGNIDIVRRDLQVIARALTSGADDEQRGAAVKMVDDLQVALYEAREGTERISGIIRDLRTISRVGGTWDSVDLTRITDAAVNMAFNQIRHRARLVKDYEPLPPIYGCASQLSRVVLNLLLNAAQAIREGAAPKHQITVRLRQVDETAVLAVSDTGEGIPPENLPRLFDPFFTTRAVGEGTGLGLTMARDIVHAHCGELTVTSELGRGSSFEIRLPRYELVSAEPAAAEVAGPAPSRARILVIDDEQFVGRSIERILGGDHEVVFESRGDDALARLANGERFDLILCDLMMPDTSGMEVFQQLQRRWPAQADKLAFLTGGAFTSQARAFLSTISKPVLDKPLSVDSLRDFVREFLHRRP